MEPSETNPPPELLALVVAWCRDRPERVGEVLLPLPPKLGGHAAWEFGRGSDGRRRLAFIRQRPGVNQTTSPFEDKRISRDHLTIRPLGQTLEIDNHGRRPLLINGKDVARSTVGAGGVRPLEARGASLAT